MEKNHFFILFSASDVLIFTREAMAKFDHLRATIIEKLLEAFSTIKSARVSRAALWILGEYCEKPMDIQAVMNEIRQSLGEIPIVEDELRKAGMHFLLILWNYNFTRKKNLLFIWRNFSFILQRAMKLWKMNLWLSLNRSMCKELQLTVYIQIYLFKIWFHGKNNSDLFTFFPGTYATQSAFDTGKSGTSGSNAKDEKVRETFWILVCNFDFYLVLIFNVSVSRIFLFFLGTSTIKKIPYGRWFLHRRSLGHDIDQIIIALFRNCFEIWPQRPSKGQLFNDLHFFQLCSISRKRKR